MTGVPAHVVPYDPFVLTTGPFAPLSTVFWIDVKTYGAAGDGSTDDAAAINSAITAASAAGGGTVYFPAGHYRILSPLVLASLVGIRLVGQVPANSGAGAASKIHYDNGNTDARVIDARTSSGIEIDHLTIYSNASFAGILIDFNGTVGSGTSFGYVHDCIVGSTLDTLDSSLISLDYTAQMKIINNNLTGGVNNISGAAAGHNSDSVIVRGNQLTKYSSAAILNPGGQKWTITENDFEPMAGVAGTAGQSAVNCLHSVSSLTFANNWIGDGGTDDIIALWLQGTNIVVRNNFFGAAAAPGGGKVHKVITVLGTTRGLTVEDNYVSGNFPTFIDYGFSTVTGAVVRKNILAADVTTVFANAGSVTRYEYRMNTSPAGARVAGTDVFCHSTASALQTIATGLTATALAFNVDESDVDNMHPIGAGNDTFTIPFDGVYEIHGSVWFTASALGTRSLEIWKAAAAPPTRYSIAWGGNPSGANQAALETHAVVRLLAGDTIQLRASQTTGGNLDTVVTDGRAMVWASIARIME